MNGNRVKKPEAKIFAKVDNIIPHLLRHLTKAGVRGPHDYCHTHKGWAPNVSNH